MNTIDKDFHLQVKGIHEKDKIILHVKGEREDGKEGMDFKMMEEPVIQRKGDEYFIEWKVKKV